MTSIGILAEMIRDTNNKVVKCLEILSKDSTGINDALNKLNEKRHTRIDEKLTIDTLSVILDKVNELLASINKPRFNPNANFNRGQMSYPYGMMSDPYGNELSRKYKEAGISEWFNPDLMIPEDERTKYVPGHMVSIHSAMLAQIDRVIDQFRESDKINAIGCIHFIDYSKLFEYTQSKYTWFRPSGNMITPEFNGYVPIRAVPREITDSVILNFIRSMSPMIDNDFKNDKVKNRVVYAKAIHAEIRNTLGTNVGVILFDLRK
jgi:hypothetical protein